MSYSGKFKDKNNNLHPVTSVLYGTCDTAAATAAKVVTCSDFDALMTGVTIRVKFANANTAASPTVNINSTGAKSVYRFGSTAPVDGNSWNAGEVVELVYDGTSFFMTGADDLSVKQNVTDNSLQTTDKTVVGAINEHEGDIGSLRSGLTNYENQNDLNLEVPDRKNIFNYDKWSRSIYGIKCTVVTENNGVTLTATGSDAYTAYKANEFPLNARVPVKVGDTITLSWDEEFNKSGGVYIFGNGDTILANANNNVVKKLSCTIPNGVTFITFRFGVSNAGETISYKNIQIEHGSISTPYAPYIPSVNSRLETVESGLTNWRNERLLNESYAKVDLFYNTSLELAEIIVRGTSTAPTAGMITVTLPAYANPSTSFTIVGRNLTMEVRTDLKLNVTFTGDTWCGAQATYTTHQLS